MKKIFLSYARQDGKDAATKLRGELQQEGFKIWRDLEDMKGGQAWKEQLRQAIKTVDVVLVLLTPGSVDSKYVEWEWETAFNFETKVIPLLLLPCDVPSELDRLHYRDLSTDQKYLSNLILLIQDLTTQYEGTITLEKINIDAEAIQSINTHLEAIHSMLNHGVMTGEEQRELDIVKDKIHSLKLRDLNDSLKEVSFLTKSLFDTCRQELYKKRGLQLLNGNSPECVDQYINIIETLQMELEDASELADWLDANRKRMAKKHGREAISFFAEVESRISQVTIKEFCFSVNQFLEQVSHCLRWGRTNILDTPNIPLELDASIYTKAFRLAQKDLPPRISEEAKSQFDEYIDYLVERLPFYD